MTNDLILVDKIKRNEDVESSLKELVEIHKPLFDTILNRKCSNSVPKYIIEDIKGNPDLLFYEAAIKYNFSKKMKFSTFLGQWIFWHCGKSITSSESKKKFHPIFYAHTYINNQEDYPFSEKVDALKRSSDLKEIIDNLKDERAKDILKLRYFSCKKNKLTPWKEISKKIGLSYQGCLNIHNTTIKNIRKRIKLNEINY
jgi:DNA-directed RNA polymerase specialized sigma subunit